ncbi:hypothetical protein OPQ81_003455 [Rhizoctonia solani]|nr:hypothetical protein OPQ81_003455 [Rhizoctonia solani]
MNYPPPISPTPRGTIIPRALTPLVNTSIQGSTPPALETVNRALLPGWTCSTHIFQAAMLRDSPPPGPSARTPIPSEIGKAERQALADAKFSKIKELRGAISSQSRSFPKNDAKLWMVVNRYAPDKPRVGASPAVTIILTHGSGFHKEIWETTLRYLLSTFQGQASIDEIWALDAVNHGDSGILNKDNLGEIFEWSDGTRDILNFITNYLPDKIEDGHVDRNLSRISEQAAQQRLQHGFKDRAIVGIGHSFGGSTLTRAVIESPQLFSSIILVDPVIYASYVNRGPGNDALAKCAIIRRDHWPDRESAKSGFVKSPFFQTWHPDVLADYIKYGIVEDEQGARLKCSGYQEAVIYGESSRLPCEVWELLPTLDERIPIKWIMDSTRAEGSLYAHLLLHFQTVLLIFSGMSRTGGPEHTRHTVWRRPSNSTNTQIKGTTHLVPLEAPEALAREILDFIQMHHRVKSKL